MTATTKKIETTQGEIIIRPMTRRQRNEIALMGAKKPDESASAEEQIRFNIDLENKMMDFIVVEGREKIDDLESAEVDNIIAESTSLQAEYLRKN